MTEFNTIMKKVNEKIEKIRNSEKINIIFKDGRQVCGRMMCVFDCEPMNYVYMLFTDDTKTADGLYNTYIAKFNKMTGVRIELVERVEAEELEMINDVIKQNLSIGIFKKKSICNLQFGGIAEVYFD